MERSASGTEPGVAAAGGARPVAVRLACPRCGYDVSGPVAMWATSCPVEGVCPECGLAFRWGDVFDPLRDVPEWFFELAPRRRVRALLSTVLRTLIPWRFWRAIRLSFPIRYVRLVTLVITLFLVWQLVTPLLDAIAHFIFVMDRAPPGTRAGTVLGYMAGDWRLFMAWPIGRPDAVDRVLSAWLLTSAIIPACFLTISESLAEARARPAHFVRAATYSAVSLIVIWMTWNAIQLLAEIETRFDPFQWHWKHWENRWLDRWITIISGGTLHGEVSWPFLYPLWMLLTWWCVCRFYLRIRHAFLTALLLFTLAILLTPIVGYPLGYFDALIEWLT